MTDRQLLELLVDKMTGFEVDMKDLKSDVAELRSDVTVLKSDVAELKNRMSGVEGEITGLKEEMANLKGEVTILGEEMTNLKGEVTILKEESISVKDILRRMEKRQEAIFEQTGGLIEFRNETTKALAEIKENQMSMAGILGDHEIQIRNLQRRVGQSL